MRVRHHVNPFVLEQKSARLAPLELPAGRPVEVEIGCADAEFLFARAGAEPNGVHVGLEIPREWVDWVNRKAVREDRSVRAVLAHANVSVPILFPRGSVARFFVNFPDPWFKRWQKKRRLVDDRLVLGLHAALTPGGDVFFQSDVWNLALDALAVFENHADKLENLAGPWSFWHGGNPYEARSRRERRCEADGKVIWRMRYRRRVV